MKYIELLKLNKKMKPLLDSKIYKVNILSNITINQIKDILEYSLRVENINCDVSIGNYDNIVQDSQKCNDFDLVVIFWELCNIIDGLQYKIELFNEKQFNDAVEKIKLEINFVLDNLYETSLVLINKFTSIHFSYSSIQCSNLDKMADILNQYLENKVSANVKIIDLEKVITALGQRESTRLHYYYSTKTLYTVDFLKEYANHIKPFPMSANGKSKKIVVFDCDNTLWKGVLGEEGFNNIEMSSNSQEGAIYAEIQSIALSLNNRGVLIGLCSKNEPNAVDEVIKKHNDMQLKSENISNMKINWKDKVTNLISMSEELNIGLDSFVL